ncbi:MAG: hypothetical protein A2073_04950 [Deltaproteobacteria bacterium GWC2_42_11]|nr:MAG: hypothetical protein A2073_04950 [Deltaproteobacteria bacterium GWC2_42_11]HBO85028.1 hypothetical protein [Deltaproteobacteria bacterium]
MKSWDAFIIPYPFSNGVFICGDPIAVSPDLTPEELEDKRLCLEKILTDINERADNYWVQ